MTCDIKWGTTKFYQSGKNGKTRYMERPTENISTLARQTHTLSVKIWTLFSNRFLCFLWCNNLMNYYWPSSAQHRATYENNRQLCDWRSRHLLRCFQSCGRERHSISMKCMNNWWRWLEMRFLWLRCHNGGGFFFKVVWRKETCMLSNFYYENIKQRIGSSRFAFKTAELFTHAYFGKGQLFALLDTH